MVLTMGSTSGIFIMRNIFLIVAAIGCASTDKAGACNLRLPTFEVTGFPISPHQVAVQGAAYVEEGSATPTLKLAGMPASPHQIAVLTRIGFLPQRGRSSSLARP